MKQNWIKKYKQADPRGIEPPTGNRIGNLDPLIPFTGDPISQGDDHLRATKRALQGSFPLVGDNPVEITAAQWNHAHARFSVGMITSHISIGGVTQYPEGWVLSDGNEYNGFQTLDLRGYFVKTSGLSVPGYYGGVETTEPAPTEKILGPEHTPAHSHSGTYGPAAGSGSGGTGDDYDPVMTDNNSNYTSSSVWGSEGVALAHNHTVDTFDNQPAFLTESFIVYVGVTI